MSKITYEDIINSSNNKQIFNEFIKDVYNNDISISKLLDNIKNDFNDVFNNLEFGFNYNIINATKKAYDFFGDNSTTCINGKNVAGIVIEDFTIKYLQKYFKNIIKHPNGEMNFPDLSINNYLVDIKSVLCVDNSPNYNNSIESKTEVNKKLKSFFEKDKNYNDIGNAFILYVYYSCENNNLKILKCHFVPLISTIRYNKKKMELSIKSAGTNDGNGQKIAKNLNVTIGLNKTDKRSYNQIYNDLKCIVYK